MHKIELHYLLNMAKILANPKRILIINQLVGGEKTVSEISLALQMSHNTVSLYLSKMRVLNMVNSRSKNGFVYYSIRDKNLISFLQMQEGKTLTH